MTLRVFVDASVLFSRTLRDWLFLLRVETNGGTFQLHTTWDIITETGARLRDAYPEADSGLLMGLMQKFQECVDEVLPAFPGGPVEGIADEGDWHVHHAAEACRASVLLTEDQGFALDGTHYAVYSSDEFFMDIWRQAPDAVMRVVEMQAAYWSKRNGKQLPDALRDAGCWEFADMVLGLLKEMAARAVPD